VSHPALTGGPPSLLLHTPAALTECWQRSSDPALTGCPPSLLRGRPSPKSTTIPPYINPEPSSRLRADQPGVAFLHSL
jgi:hypothetical protein